MPDCYDGSLLTLWRQGDTVIAREPLAGIKRDIEPLLPLHHADVGFAAEWRINWAHYEEREAAGALVAFSVREAETLIGYAIFLCVKHAHYVDLTQGLNDALFLRPDKRRGLLGRRLIERCDFYFQHTDIQHIVWHVTAQKDFSPILRRLGYAPEAALWGKARPWAVHPRRPPKP